MRAYVEQIWDDCSKFFYFQYRDNHFLIAKNFGGVPSYSLNYIIMSKIMETY